MSPIYCQTKKRKMFMTVNTYTHIRSLYVFNYGLYNTVGIRMKLIMNRNKEEKERKKKKTYLSDDIFCVKITQKKMNEIFHAFCSCSMFFRSSSPFYKIKIRISKKSKFIFLILLVYHSI